MSAEREALLAEWNAKAAQAQGALETARAARRTAVAAREAQRQAMDQWAEADAALWDLVPAMVRAGFKVDMPGHGKSVQRNR